MEVRGKILAGIVGMIVCDLAGLPLGGVWGFALGAMLGHVLYDRRRDFEASEREFRAYQRRQGEYLYHVFSLSAKLAKADGPVNRHEVNFMERLIRHQFRLTDRGRANVVRVWKDAKDSNTPFEQYARAFYLDFARERHQVLNMLDLLFAAAAADGGLHPREEELLLRAAGLFHIGRLQYDRIKYRYYQAPKQQPRWSSLDPYYAILGAQPTEPLDVIKRKFRKLAMEWHPDKIQAKGASNEAVRHAKEKFQQINEAYEKIVEARK
ncbi:MAG: TerB family tellurite resistance protein [Saprospirales bacterium]|jgi:DnaJ like chaperone protein|nr:TerB family tellurite resistance protein [Saprospirales bacterium]MBK8923316.1 TerB family tellurite resistance protein [Saprospirales bacterium]